MQDDVDDDDDDDDDDDRKGNKINTSQVLGDDISLWLLHQRHLGGGAIVRSFSE
tara:strand:+ start:93 stop:254 length:162 start_codon:yes stop_codon:yes gene_type:complete